jgi:hypothetical protein
MQISSDGRSLVQYRYGNANRSFGARSVDAHVSAGEAQAALALLRGELGNSPFARGRGGRMEVAPLYLAQARAAGATFLGQTRALGRPAFLLTYRTNQLPTQPAQQPAGPQSQVILTIDSQTSTLLDIAVVATGAAESSALHPLQAQIFEVLSSAPDTLWRLPTTAGVEQRNGLPSARLPDLPSTRVIGLDDALRRAPNAILAPRQLPSAEMRGLALPLDESGAQGVQLLYEGEFQSVMLAPLENRNVGALADGTERSAGEFRYRMLQLNGPQASRAAAIAFRPAAPEQQVLVMLVDEYATAAEREAALGQIISSLTPVTRQNLPALGRNFYGSPTAGGQG